MEKSSVNFLRCEAVEGIWAASRRSSQVQPSLWAANFFGILDKASETAVKGIEFFAGFRDEGWGGTWECLAWSVCLAKKVAATSGSASIP